MQQQGNREIPPHGEAFRGDWRQVRAGFESNADSGVLQSVYRGFGGKNKQRSGVNEQVSGGFVVSGGSVVNFSGCDGCAGSAEFPDPVTVAGRSERDTGGLVPEER
jgi:hypothetical protein